MPITNKVTRLTKGQITFFKTFGFIVLRKLFTEYEMGVIEEEHRIALATAFPDEPFSEKIGGQWTRMNDENYPFYASLPEDPRILTPAQQLCGDDVIGNGTDAHFAGGDTPWHTDGWEQEVNNKLEGIKYHFTLDQVTAKTGALRFIPGSHLLRGEKRTLFGKSIDDMPSEDVPSHPASTQPGDIVVFDIRVWHASFGGAPDRRTSNIEYFSNPKTSQEETRLRDIGRLESNSRNANKYTFSKNWLHNPHASSYRNRWIKRLTEIGYFNQPGVGEF